MAVHVIAEKLGKFAWEVQDQMTPRELAKWLAFYKIRREEEEKAYQDSRAKAKAEAQSRQPRRRR